MPPKVYRKRKRTFRKKPNAYRMARTALRKVNNVIKAEEVKKADFSTLHTTTPIDWTGAVYPVTAVIGQGSTPFTRVGREVALKYVSIQGKIQFNPNFTIGGSNTVRFLVFEDRSQQLGLDPATSVVLENVGSAVAPFSRYFRQELGRFRFIRDFKLSLNSQMPSRDFKINISFKRKPHKQLHNGTAQTDDMKGTIYLMLISDVGLTTNAPTIIATARTGFTDD